MGRKKGSKSKPPKPSKSKQTTPSSDDQDIIRRARTAYHLAASKHQIAHKQIKQLCAEHSGNALLFRTQAEILEKCSDEATTDDNKARFMENAIYCARKATTLSPNSMDFSSFLGHLFCRSSVGPGDYKKAIEQLNTALNIPRPSDPAQETLLTDEEIQSRFPTYEARIDDARKRIFKFIGDCVVMLKDLKTNIKEFLEILQVRNDEEKLYVAWHSLSVHEKHRFLQVSVVDLKSRLVPLKLRAEVVSFALHCFASFQKWQFWMCPTCRHKFPTSMFFLHHLVRTHLKEVLAEFKNAYSLGIMDWIAFIEKINWRPLDTPGVITTLEKQKQSKSPTPGEWEGQSLPKETPQEELMRKRSLFNQESLLSSDSERGSLLSKIHKKLRGFVSSDWFMAFHLDMMLQRAMKKLTGLLGDCLKELNMEHYCLCLLDASQLNEILRFLDDMSNFAGKIHKKKGINEDILSSRTRPTEIPGEITLSKNSLYLTLLEHSLRRESTSGSSSKKDNSKHQQPVIDDWISWICSGPSIDAHLEEWITLVDKSLNQAKEQVAKFQKVLSGSSENRHEIQEKIAADVVPTDGSGPEVGKEIGISPQKPEEDASIQAMIHEEEEDSVLSESDRQILDVSVDIQQLELILSCLAVNSYQPILLSIVKAYLREHLEGIVANIAIKTYDPAAGNVDALIGKDLGTEEVRHPFNIVEPIVVNQESSLGQTSATPESFNIIFGSFDLDELERMRQQNLVNQQVGLGGSELTGICENQGFDPAETEEAVQLKPAEENAGDGVTDNPEDDNQDMSDILDKHAEENVGESGTDNSEDDNQYMIDILDRHGITIEVQSVDDVEEADTRMRASLPPRPVLEAIQAAEVPSEIIANRDQLLEVINKKKRPEDIPEEQFKLLKRKQKNFLLYLIDEEERKTAELFGLEKIHAQMEDPGSSSSSDMGSDAEDVKRGHFEVIAMDAGKPKRYIISVDYLNHPEIRSLLDQAEVQCDFEHERPVILPCSATKLDTILAEEWKP